jgi:hypothetical protein
MKSYKKHLQSTKSFGESDINSLRRPVYRTSAIFPIIDNSNLKTKILFMGYWLLKRKINSLGFLASIRDQEGTLIHRINTEINTPNAKEIIIGDILNDIGLGNKEFIGSIELEVFSIVDLVFPYPAFVLNYYNDFGSGVVHTAGRIYNDFEDLRENEEIKVKEAGFDLVPGENYSPFFSFVNGHIESTNTNIEIEIITENGTVYNGSINLGTITPLETVFVKFKDYLPISDILEGKTGTVKIKHELTGFFPRFIAGNFCTDNEAVSITHTYYDNSEVKGAEHYHENDRTDIL